MLALQVEPAIIEVTKEEGHVLACLLAIEAMAEILLAITELLVGEMVGGTAGMAIVKVASEVVTDACEVVLPSVTT